MFVARVMSTKLSVPHTKTGSREVSVVETVVCVRNDSFFQTRTKADGAASVRNKLNVGSLIYAGVCPASD